jgi:hypothetical protein
VCAFSTFEQTTTAVVPAILYTVKPASTRHKDDMCRILDSMQSVCRKHASFLFLWIIFICSRRRSCEKVIHRTLPEFSKSHSTSYLNMSIENVSWCPPDVHIWLLHEGTAWLQQHGFFEFIDFLVLSEVSLVLKTTSEVACWAGRLSLDFHT